MAGLLHKTGLQYFEGLSLTFSIIFLFSLQQWLFSVFKQEVTDCAQFRAVHQSVEDCCIPLIPHIERRIAALAADIVYNAFSGTNDIVWKLDMKNGDRIILRHRFNAVFLDSVVITAADVPLDTMEDLRSFLRQASEKYTSAAVTIYLPAVTYEGDLDLSSRGFEFIGSTENGRQTSFRGHIRVSDRTLQIPTFRNIAFPGSGGTGIAVATALELHQCAITGWDTGVLVENGGWVGLHECLFEANETGFLFDSISATMVDEIYDSNRFINNETAVSLLRVPGTVPLSFPKTLFSGNRVDLLNSCNAPVDMSDAIIK